ncbi:MAG: D-alanine--D-alanine ligase [Oscillospiraceae bacterium]|nr:D-alanine--D-alanine ligase [Oscillospiraceae bacterium]
MKNALIVFGGVSSEHDISLLSASSVIRNIPKDKYNPVLLGITKDGAMYLYEGDPECLPNDEWLKNEALLKKAVISTDRRDKGILVFNGDGYELIKIHVCFPVLHGKNGEDGTVQGLLTVAGIPFVGCGTMASAVCMDKAMTNGICDVNGIPQAKWKYITAYDFGLRGKEFARECAEYLGLPAFIKPANAGSSVGVRKAKTEDEIYSALRYAFTFDDRVVVEEGIDGIEVECAVMGNDEPFAGEVGEIEPCNEFYDFNAKYIDNKSGLHIPARLPLEKREEIRTLAVKVYKSCGCTGLARVDFFVRKSDGEVLLNEPNTIPGFTSISMYPMLMDKAGIPYGELIDRLFRYAEERGIN